MDHRNAGCGFGLRNAIIGMYGPPQSCKRKTNDGKGGLRKCIGPLMEYLTPDYDGDPLALVPINGLDGDLYRYQVSRAWRRPIEFARLMRIAHALRRPAHHERQI